VSATRSPAIVDTMSPSTLNVATTLSGAAAAVPLIAVSMRAASASNRPRHIDTLLPIHLNTLATALAKRLRVEDAILDGEIICADESGRPESFLDLLRR
jgi:hypothetical protein